MADVSIVNSAIQAVPKDYSVPGAQELFPEVVTANMDGTAAGVAWIPTLQLLDPAGHVMMTAVSGTTVAAGGSADVSWFPGASEVVSGGGSGPLEVTDGITSVTSVSVLEAPPASVSNDSGAGKITLGQIYFVPPPTGVAATDNAAIQAGLTNVTTGGIVMLCPGTYAITGLTISKTLRLMGAGGADALFANWGTNLQCASQTAVAINVSAHGVTLENFAIQNTFGGTPTSASAGVKVVSGAGNEMHYGPNFSVRGFYINVDHQAGSEWSMEPSCFLYDFVHTGLHIQNVDSVDGGDMVVSGEFVAGPTNNGNAAVQWDTGGGLKFYSAKINNRGGKTLTVGIAIEMQDGVTTGDLLFSNCSVENCTYGILVENAGGAHTAVLRKLIVNGCQFDQTSIVGSYGIRINPAATNQLSSVNISGCTFSDAASVGLAIGNTNIVSHGPNTFENCTTGFSDTGGNTNITSVGNG